MLKRLFLMICVLIFISSCSKNSLDLAAFDLNEGEIQMIYNETQCADPWDESNQLDYTGSPEERITRVISYLQSLDLNIIAVEYDFNQENVIACLECNCLSGGTFYIKLKDDAEVIEELENIGFYRYN